MAINFNHIIENANLSNEKIHKEIEITIGNLKTKGNFRHANNSKGLILFPRGNGSCKMSIGDNYVAEFLLDKGLSSLLFDLLTVQEDAFYENRFDIPLLTSRLIDVTAWIKNFEDVKNLSIGYFGTGTWAASALNAAAQLGNKIKAVVSKSGRPDLALAILPYLKSPTLLLVAGKDGDIIDLNIKAQEKISGICELKIIEGAKQLFSEPAKLEIVAEETFDWFNKYL